MFQADLWDYCFIFAHLKKLLDSLHLLNKQVGISEGGIDDAVQKLISRG